MADVFTLGLDVGSAASKCLILKNGSETVSHAVASSGAGTSGPARALAAALTSAGLARSDIALVTATGYGRATVEGADFAVSELSCHALGAAANLGGVRTVIDIGGQDAKALSLDAEGRLRNFIMNDKCAAGTGRFLEVMARVLELEPDNLEALDARADGVIPISSTCTVFAESEVISQLSRGAGIPELVAGIHESVAVRAAALVKRLGVTEPVMMCGGVALNGGVVRALERELGVALCVPPLPQLNGAYGAALYAFQKLNNKQKGDTI